MIIKGILDLDDARDAVKFGADSVMIGRSYAYALAAQGQKWVENLLDLFKKEMRVAMTLTGANSISDITYDSLVNNFGFLEK